MRNAIFIAQAVLFAALRRARLGIRERGFWADDRAARWRIFLEWRDHWGSNESANRDLAAGRLRGVAGQCGGWRQSRHCGAAFKLKSVAELRNVSCKQNGGRVAGESERDADAQRSGGH